MSSKHAILLLINREYGLNETLKQKKTKYKTYFYTILVIGCIIIL